MKNIHKYLLIALIASLTSCTKFLDLQPEDKLLEEQVFSSAKNVKAYLNGVYIKLGTGPLYGESLTLTVPDLLAHRYNITATNNTLYPYTQHRYTDANVSNKMAEIWKQAYTSVFNVNRFIANLNNSPGILDARMDSTYRGEALAIRAMLHFDMLRLFGPMYNSTDSIMESIPYNSFSVVAVPKILPANKVMENILFDLKKAEELLFADQTMNTDKKYRFTYFSVKALQARVNLYRGDKAEALKAAKAVIDKAALFPWVTVANMNNKGNADRIFSTEMILGAYNPDLYTDNGPQATYFAAGLADNKIMTAHKDRLEGLFLEANDFRFGYNQLWAFPPNKTYRTFFKYEEIEDKSKPYRNTIPLLKLSEMYYIAAECEPNPADGIVFLNKVRYQRNISSTLNAAQLIPELTLEYQREFFGEGQLFFYYKRNNFLTIPIGTHGKNTYTMGTSKTLAVKYVVPLPYAETDPRK